MSTSTIRRILHVRSAADDLDWRHVRALLDDYVDWIHEHTGVWLPTDQAGSAHELANPHEHYANDGGTMLIGYLDGQPAGIVGVQHHPDGRGELKRMYTIPAARGSGLAGRLLDSAVGEALRHGDRSIWLETARRDGYSDRPVPAARIPAPRESAADRHRSSRPGGDGPRSRPRALTELMDAVIVSPMSPPERMSSSEISGALTRYDGL